MSVKTYDPKKVVIIVGGVPMTGYSKGTHVKVSRDNDSFTKYTGTDGTGSRAKSNDKGGTIVLTLARTSPSNDVLSALVIADEISGDGVVPVLVKDLRGTTLHFSDAGWVKKPADDESGKEVTEREWTIDCSDLSMFNGGNTTSLT